MDVSILIISYNTRDLTLACIDSVVSQTSAVGFELVVVDNASIDGSAEAIAKAFPTVKLIVLKKNVGFAAANNLAAHEAQGERLLLLNPDTVIMDHAIDRAVSFARANPTAGIVGGRTFFGDGSLNYNSCHGRPTPWSLICHATGLASLFRRSRLLDPESLGSWRRDSVRRVDAVTGCFLLIESALWRELKGFDEAYFMYGEDTDLCLRAWKLGRACMICPEVKLIHHGAQSERVRADKMVRLFRAKAQLFQKHWSGGTVGLGVCCLRLWALSRTLALGVMRLVQPRRRAAFETWREIWHRRAEFQVTSQTAVSNQTDTALA